MLFHHPKGILRTAGIGALDPAVFAGLDIGNPPFVEGAQHRIAVFFGLLRIGCTVDIIAEALMVGAVAVVLDHIGNIPDQKDDTGGIGQPPGLLHRHMAVAHHGTILRKPDQIQQHIIPLFPGVVDEPLPVRLHRPAEKGVGIGEALVHIGLAYRIRQRPVTVKVLVNVIERQTVLLGQRTGGGAFSAAGRSCDEINVLQICFQYIILQYHGIDSFIK